MDRSVRIGVLLERRYSNQPQPKALIASLWAGGHDVAVIDPDRVTREIGDNRWLRRFDVLVARGRSVALCSLLTRAEALGIPTINRCASIAAVHNKANMAATLAAAKVPAPRTYVAPTTELSQRLPQDRFPLILKPVFGDNGRGLRVVHSRAELAALAWPEPVALAQDFVNGSKHDLKLYGIGGEILAVRKPSPLNSGNGDAHVDAEPVPLTSELRELGRTCRRLFGLDFYGVDCLPTREGCVVIEVNEFPNYSGIPDAGDKLARYVSLRLKQARQES